MTLFATVTTENNAVTRVRAYLSEEGAREEEREWLAHMRILNERQRERKRTQGLNFAVWEAELRP